MKIKICGLSKLKEVQFCIKEKVDFCGFILNYPKSHRFISYDKFKKIIDLDKKNTKFIGVLVSPSNKELEKYSKLNLDYFQIYGRNTLSDLQQIKNDFKTKIIPAIQVKNEADIHKYRDIEEISDIILWDSSGYEKSLSWNYEWMRNVTTKAKKMVAGNITIDTLETLFKLADIVDISGAAETNKVKDIEKIKNFLKKISKINEQRKY